MGPRPAAAMRTGGVRRRKRDERDDFLKGAETS